MATPCHEPPTGPLDKSMRLLTVAAMPTLPTPPASSPPVPGPTSLASHLPDWLDPTTLPGMLGLAAITVVIGLILSWLLRQSLRELLTHDRSERIDQITIEFLTRLGILIMWVVLVGLYAHLVPPLNKVGTALLAGASLVSVIVGFAAQTTLSNLVSGISLVLYKPFRRGDRLQVMAPTADQCETGTVEDISLGFTVLRTDDGRQIIVANATMAQQTMIKLASAPQAEPAPVPATATTSH